MTLPFMGIAPVQLAAAQARDWRVTKVLSILDPDQPCPQFDCQHLLLRFHDVNHGSSAASWIEPPLGGHIAKIIQFARDLTEDDRVLVHCAMGISRSPAAALTIVAARTGCARAAVTELRRMIPSGDFDPNRRMVALADRQLGLRGALEEAAKPPIRPAPDRTKIW